MKSFDKPENIPQSLIIKTENLTELKYTHSDKYPYSGNFSSVYLQFSLWLDKVIISFSFFN